MFMKKILNVSISLIILLAVVGCGNDEAKRKYEQEKQKLELMQEEHRVELNRAIASGSSEPQIGILKIEHAQQEMEQAKLVSELAQEAGIDD